MVSAERSAHWFAEDTKNHQLTVLHDDGLYRHLRIKAKEGSSYWYDVVTWPGHLAFAGDMEGFTFARAEDMFQFFRASGGKINPTYWGQKVVSGGASVQKFSDGLFRRRVWQEVRNANELSNGIPGLARAVQLALDCEDDFNESSAARMLEDFHYKGSFAFDDWFEWRITDFSHSFLWCCHAIVHAISEYDKLQKAGDLR